MKKYFDCECVRKFVRRLQKVRVCYRKKSQAALEFLATYGWAFLVILIVIAALSYFGILSPSKLLPDRCNFGAEFGCSDYSIGSNGVNLRLKNSVGQAIIIDEITASSEDKPLNCPLPISSTPWKSGETKAILIACTDFATSGLVAGEKGKLNLKIKYHNVRSSIAFAKDVNGEVFAVVKGGVVTSGKSSCKEILNNGGSTGDGIYTIIPSGIDEISVYCDMTTDGGGWTLVLLNSPYSPHPNPSWNDVVNSNNVQGNLNSGLTAFDQFLGVKYWNLIGNNMRVEVGSSPTSISHRATYTFSLNTANNYALSMSNQNILIGGNAPGMFTYHAANNFQLSTYDADHDAYGGNCAQGYGDAWWFGACWDGNFWGGIGHTNNAYWTSSTTDHYPWGAIWVR